MTGFRWPQKHDLCMGRNAQQSGHAWPIAGCYERDLTLTLSVKMLVALSNLYKEVARSLEIVVWNARLFMCQFQ
jgi:hypothetical protein